MNLNKDFKLTKNIIGILADQNISAICTEDLEASVLKFEFLIKALRKDTQYFTASEHQKVCDRVKKELAHRILTGETRDKS